MRCICTQQVRIMILDINDNAPLFPVLSTAVEVSESAEPGTSFIIPAAEDLDSPKYSVRNYRISPPTSHFNLSVRVVTPPAGTGSDEVGDDVGTAPPTQIRLVLRERVDRESAEHFRLFVVATDAGHPVQSGALVVDRSLPVVRRGDGRRTSGPTGSAGRRPVTSGCSSWRRTPDIRSSRERWSSTGHFRLFVVATDAGPPVRSGTLVVNVTVTDVNDNAPRFVRPGSGNAATSGPVETRLPESASVGTTVYRMRAVDADTGDYGRVR